MFRISWLDGFYFILPAEERKGNIKEKHNNNKSKIKMETWKDEKKGWGGEISKNKLHVVGNSDRIL